MLDLETNSPDNETWQAFNSVVVAAEKHKYIVLPHGYSVHWIRAKITENAKVTAYFTYN